MRDYQHIDKYISSLTHDIYPQPSDVLHQQWAMEFIDQIGKIALIKTVLDVGCGQGMARTGFINNRMDWTGVTLEPDYTACIENGLMNVHNMDMSFLKFDDNLFDLVFARHVLEHSPMPLLTLMEWRRVSNKYLAVVLPNPNHFLYFGKNHYSVMNSSQFIWIASRAGWRTMHISGFETKQEMRFILVKDEEKILRPYLDEEKLKEIEIAYAN